MLSLSRYPGESLYLFDKDNNPIAQIKINSTKGNQVSVGIQANKSIGIVRNELIEEDRLQKISEDLR